ncbi:ABC transporter ATP-binding protein [Dolichospermum sp. FACHB-1091]|uniref:ABC transporter ATP-binding protein n=1 Tax=Dolichospermum sp. FACHB-1091 TaxID=2692798 RepID=UPI0016800BF5|nr:ABC transporter ATP-binding protein [Dolichospermum sp. FACHB-1091]MBD2445258.1 ABC transporter ATP-binding protein [Dolichospermum sp. FACHB-1091]
MSDTVIRVENLGKKYIIGHQQQERYTALRDVITNKVKSIGNLLNPQAKNENPAFEEFWSLKDVSFEIKQGDRVGIIGRNGAGKSTLLKILSRITEPTKGSIKIKGRVASLLEVGTGFHPELTGRENVFLNGAILGMGKEEIKRKFDEIVAFAEVEKFLDTPVKRYSSGMYVRLAFAVAAHLEPEILIVDEVLAVGDSAFQKKCLGKMEDVAEKEGRTVLFVSHNMGAINKLCNLSIWMNFGKIQLKDQTEEVIGQYLSTAYSNSHKKEFQIRPDKKGQIKSVRLMDDHGLETSDFSCGTRPTIEIEFILNTPVTGCHIACIVSTSDGQHLFSTADTDNNSERLNKRQPGDYLVQVKLPMEFFNVATYHVSVGLGIPGIESFDRQEAVSFNLHDTGDFGTLKEGSRRSGLFLVSTEWKYV